MMPRGADSPCSSVHARISWSELDRNGAGAVMFISGTMGVRKEPLPHKGGSGSFVPFDVCLPIAVVVTCPASHAAMSALL